MTTQANASTPESNKPLENPFQVLTPEDMPATDVKSLFVDVFEQFYLVRDQGHSFLSGPRGCGKSMIFRYLLPDCQRLVRECALRDLPHFGALVRFKNTAPNLTEFRRLNNDHASVYLNEHVLTLYVAKALFETLATSTEDEDDGLEPARVFFQDIFVYRLKLGGFRGDLATKELNRISEVFGRIATICDDLYARVNQYAKRLAWPGTLPDYQDALLGFGDFLYPLIKGLRTLPFMPKGPIFLLLDDADYLSNMQTRILNSWVSTRTAADVSLKISTQLRYKTYSTLSSLPVQSPHDYQEINIADIYTTSIGLYKARVKLITERRLDVAGLPAQPDAFFPRDEHQEQRIHRIADEIRASYATQGRGFRPGDDVTRYARPEYFRRLAGISKSTPSYNYAGFEQLVHISSGVIRYFLDSAARMYDLERAKAGGIPKEIAPTTQDEVIRDESEKLMFSEFDKILDEEKAFDDARADEPTVGEATQGRLQIRTSKLHNLIRLLGNTFYQKLISQDAERRVFSVALSGSPAQELIDIFELGVRYGYFHRSSIGNKDGTGRTRLYILTRRLAPYFNLDPSSFAGYLFITSDRLLEAVANPDRALRRIKDHGVGDYFESGQLSLFD